MRLGNLCGKTDGYTDKKYLYTIVTAGLGECVSSCPSEDTALTSTNNDDYYCIGENTGSLTAAAKTSLISACMTAGSYDYTKTSTYACSCNIKLKTTNIVYRCIFSTTSVADRYDNQDISSDYFANFMADVMIVRNIIFGYGFLVSLFLAGLFCHLLKYNTFSPVLVWSSIFFTFACLCALVGVAQYKVYKWRKESPRTHTNTAIYGLSAFSIILVVFAGLFACTMVALRQSINLAIKCLQLAVMCIEEFWLILFTPIVQLIGLALFFVPFIYYSFSIAADGEVETIYYNGYAVGKTWVYADATTTSEKLWFLFFCLLWTANFISAFGTTVIAHATATWYFTEPDKRVEAVSNMTLLRSYGTVSRYHLGTVAFGSIIIAIIQFIRAVILYIEKKSKQQGKCNQYVVKYIACVLQCVLWCAEKCMKFISKNAFIQTAIHGSSFCHGAMDSFFLVARNIGRIGAVSLVSGFALLIMKVFVTALTSATFYYFIDKVYSDQLFDLVAPTVLVMIISWMTASMFADVYSITMDTILMCYITDEEQNEGKPKFASDTMSAFVAEHGTMSVESKSGDMAAPKVESGVEMIPADGAAAPNSQFK